MLNIKYIINNKKLFISNFKKRKKKKYILKIKKIIKLNNIEKYIIKKINNYNYKLKNNINFLKIKFIKKKNLKIKKKKKKKKKKLIKKKKKKKKEKKRININ
ncbi:MAG: hypothetical protein NHG02_00565 [Candidatus Shikimatogenerans bostrichidophilus]|nr:MAG: hypothetical protein NHG02_00565 [Candidatus Shikimatogenerans bostrichidophilus]